MIGGIFACAGGCIAASAVLARDRATVKELWTTYWIQFITVSVILMPAILGMHVFALVMGMIGLRAVYELFAIAPTPLPASFKGVGFTTVGIMAAAACWQGADGLYAILPAAGCGILVLNIFRPVAPNAFGHIGVALTGMVYPGVCLAHLILIYRLPNGAVLVILMYTISETHDAFALLFGKLFGRKKIFPNLSPKKTVVGVFSGVVSVLVLTPIITVFVPVLNAWQSVGAAFLIALASLIGDLAASKLKRDAGVKDFGNVLPKQGGVLDIYDSLIFVSPIFYIYLQVVT